MTATVGNDTARELGPALEALADVLAGFHLRLPVDGGAGREALRDAVVRDIREHLLPRLDNREAPLVAAVFGATGSGKSVVVNGLAQQRVGSPGAVRPSSRRAVVWAHRDHAARYWREFLRQVRERVGPAVETIVGDDPVTRSLTLVDTPPFDLEGDDGRSIARDVLAITDLCVFVASALRYSDADAWAFMRLVQRRGVPMLFVLNRLPLSPLEREALAADYAGRLAAAGLLLEADPALVFTIPEQATDPVHGGLPATAVAGLRHELEELTDRDLRRRLTRQATRGAVLDLADRVRPLAEAVAAEQVKASELRAAVADAYGAAHADLADQLREGALDGAGQPAEAAGHLATHLAGTAAQQAAAAWEADPVGRALLEGEGGALWRHAPDTHAAAEKAFAAWTSAIGSSVAEQLPRRARRRQRRAATRLQRAALAPAGSDTAGDGVDPELAARARQALLDRLGAVLARDAARFTAAAGEPERLAPAVADLGGIVEQVTVAAQDLA